MNFGTWYWQGYTRKMALSGLQRPFFSETDENIAGRQECLRNHSSGRPYSENKAGQEQESKAGQHRLYQFRDSRKRQTDPRQIAARRPANGGRIYQHGGTV